MKRSLASLLVFWFGFSFLAVGLVQAQDPLAAPAKRSKKRKRRAPRYCSKPRGIRGVARSKSKRKAKKAARNKAYRKAKGRCGGKRVVWTSRWKYSGCPGNCVARQKFRCCSNKPGKRARKNKRARKRRARKRKRNRRARRCQGNHFVQGLARTRSKKAARRIARKKARRKARARCKGLRVRWMRKWKYNCGRRGKLMSCLASNKVTCCTGGKRRKKRSKRKKSL